MHINCSPEKMVAKLQPDATSRCSPVKTHGARETKPHDLLIEGSRARKINSELPFSRSTEQNSLRGEQTSVINRKQRLYKPNTSY
jgi:hypothetical protein